MRYWGLGVFTVGMIAILAGSKGRRGWDVWSRRQRVVCSAGFVLVLAGLALMGPA
ncbi:hypothetical protein [Streptomyces filamentosus]|uniref:hypothetical protein n=1 Tax=Streptomyces filamentosus TaxID=67294 RepID=UPI0014781A22|nr:hypothetical protein [Streptomyces filamentosus]